ncbi:glycerate kinase family protein [Streptococcus catagoni]|uniref:glycerate kinase family protein n=1 Tax=Streptococcus catagoni TaxID=2654874 RepID=UPI001407579B|nr:glycerate kinase [Streptococcus catagoni]
MRKKFVLAPDSFKESMGAKEACNAMEKGILSVFKDAEITQVPMADGGEGTVDALIDATGGQKVCLTVAGPLPGQKVETYYGLLGDHKTVVIEMAKANGIELVAVDQRNPLITSTYGTGEMIKHALDHGARKIIIGIGGSVTNDGGAGMAQALGACLRNHNGEEIGAGGGALGELASIDLSNFDQRILDREIVVACDVNNPLTGPSGASYVFGPQKGATKEMVVQLDKNLAHYAEIIRKDLQMDIENYPGAGAAGGLGAGLLAFTKAKLRSGIDIVVEVNQLEEKIKEADYVFTGEGGMDFQTKFGKVPYGVSQLAKKYEKPVFACAGYIGEDVEVLYEEGITAIFGILAKAEPLEAALEKGSYNLQRTVENIARVLKISSCD